MPTKTTITYVNGHAVAVTSEQVPPSRITPDLYMDEDKRVQHLAAEALANEMVKGGEG